MIIIYKNKLHLLSMAILHEKSTTFGLLQIWAIFFVFINLVRFFNKLIKMYVSHIQMSSAYTYTRCTVLTGIKCAPCTLNPDQNGPAIHRPHYLMFGFKNLKFLKLKDKNCVLRNRNNSTEPHGNARRNSAKPF